MAQKLIPQYYPLDEIAGLLAQGYLRLREKRARVNTRGQQSLNEREISLDFIRQAERSLARNESLNEEDAND
ncbi:MAG: hypothetical protein WCJ56_09545 [bacterium]